QFGVGPPTQVPPAQVSAVVQALPSLHGALLSTKWQPLAGLQPSSVQPLLSSQTTGSVTQAWPTQRSAVVQRSVSLHSVSTLQQLAIPECVHPVGAVQESAVQVLPSSQLGGAPPWQ